MILIEQFRKLQTNPPIPPIEGMEWDEIDPMAREWVGWINLISQINRLEAIEIMKSFPFSLMKKTRLNQKENEVAETIKSDYAMTTTFLEGWETGKDMSFFKREHTLLFEKFALLSEARYKKIRGLHSETIFLEIFPEKLSIGFIWLLCEAAVCRQKIATSGLDFQELNLKVSQGKEALYQGKKKYIDILWDSASESCESQILPIESLLTLFDREITKLAWNLARSNPDFDKDYFKPFLRAEKSYNTYARRNKHIRLLQT
jgi:hypothetical protein